MKNYEFIRSNFLGFFDVLTPEGKTVDDYIDELKHTNIFESIDYNTIISFGQLPTRETIYANVESLILNERNTTSSNFPNDPNFSNQSYLALINANDAWNISTGDSTIKVAIINTGIDCTHNDIGIGNDTYSNVNTSLGENSTPYFSYGTQIAGLICAKTNNGLGIAGLAGGNNGRGVTIIPFNAIDAMNDYQIDGSLIDDYILEAVNIGARIIQIDFNSNMTSALEASINYAYNNGVTIVCGTGMDMSVAQNATAVKSPASNNKVIGVGCCTGTSNPSRYFSCYGEGIDLVAPGVLLYTTTLNNSYSHLHIGTDLAASLVTGTISLMLSVNPNLTPNEIRTILHDTAYKIPFYSSCYNSNGWCDEVGYGLLDAYAAVLGAYLINISGPDRLCGEEIYTINNFPSEASVSLGTNNGGFWIQKSSNISFDSYNSTTGELSVQQTTPGDGYIKVYYGDHLLAT
ncbi:MAG: S8 family serine peptidase, partial [Aeriscardovia sp.]|nr:S8 family serine peptidase [Aeriscardovia sp.]